MGQGELGIRGKGRKDRHMRREAWLEERNKMAWKGLDRTGLGGMTSKGKA